MPNIRTTATGEHVWAERTNTSGVDDAIWQAAGTATRAIGVGYTLRGEVEKVGGIQPLVASWASDPLLGNTARSLHTFTHHGATDLILGSVGQLQLIKANTYANLTLPTGSTRHVPARRSEAERMVQVGGLLLICNGRDQNLKWDGHFVSELGIGSVPAPPEVIMLNENGTAGQETWSPISITAGDEHVYSYKMTWVNANGQESNPSTASFAEQESAASAKRYIIAVVCDDTPPSDDVVSRNLYRSTDQLLYNFIGNLRGVKAKVWFDGVTPGTENTVELADPTNKSAPPLAHWCFPYRERVYFMPVATPSILVYTNKNEREGVAAENLLDVSSQDGSVITGWAVPSDYALIFKEDSVFRLTHDKNGLPILRRESSSVGAVGDLAITSLEGRTYFLHRTGLFVYDGSDFQPLSRQISDMVRRLPGAYLKDAFMWVEPEERRVMMSVVAGPGSSHTETWAIHVDSGALTVLPFRITAAVRYQGQTVVGYVKDNAATDIGVLGAGQTVDGDAYEGKNQGRWLDMGNPGSDKRFTSATFYFMQTANVPITVAYAVNWDDRTKTTATFQASEQVYDDGTGGAVLWNDGVWGAAREWDYARLRSVRVNLSDVAGKSIMFSWATTGANTPWRVVGYDVQYSDHGTRNQGTDPEANPSL